MMASIYRRKGRDGKPLPLWSYHYRDHNGKRVTGTATRDKTITRRIAEHLEAQAKLVRAGLKDACDLTAEKAGRQSLAVHVENYRLALLDKGDTAKHASHAAGAITRTLTEAGIERLTQIAQDPLQAALRRLKDKTSARTTNHALGAIKGFLRWCYHTGRIVSVPRWLGAFKPYHEASDRRRVRRVLTPEEIQRLLTAAESGPDEHCYGPTRSREYRLVVSGHDRAMLYRLALGTGLRDKELRSLTPEDFDLATATVRCRADNTKNAHEAVQPIGRDLCERLANWLVDRPLGKSVFVLPVSTCKLLRRDLKRAEIPYQTADGIVDAHALRHTYISSLIERGVDPKTVQVLARHSTITLTIDKYSHSSEQRKRDAIDGDRHTFAV